MWISKHIYAFLSDHDQFGESCSPKLKQTQQTKRELPNFLKVHASKHCNEEDEEEDHAASVLSAPSLELKPRVEHWMQPLRRPTWSNAPGEPISDGW